MTGTHATSDALRARAAAVLPGITQTYSKAPDQHVDGVYPVYLVSGNGCRVRDADGREYIDYPCALGPIILGYAHPAVDSAVHAQVDHGPVFSLGSPLEVEVAERLVEMIPCAQMIRFTKTGSEATAAAIRLARAYTGCDHVAQCGYHGWHDWCTGHSARNAGIPAAIRALTHEWAYNRVDTLRTILEQHRGDVACVVMEPMGVEDPLPGFLESVQELARSHGALLIFDEVITGFRLAPGGAQEYFGVIPDLAAFGKAMANGYAVAAVAGRADVLEHVAGNAFISGTFAGDPISLAAAAATLEVIRGGSVIPHLWRQGARVRDGFDALADEFGVPARMVGLAPRRVLAIDASVGTQISALKGLIWQGCLDQGVLLSNANFVSLAHDDAAVDETLVAFEHALRIAGEAMKDGDLLSRLRGSPPGEVMRKP